MFDIETAGTESNSVVLSAAIIHFELDNTESYQELVSRACYVKFKGREQINLNRVTTKDTIAWWKKQSELAQKYSLLPSENDVSAVEGLNILKDYITKNGGSKQLFWARGSLDQMAIDSLARNTNQEPITHYSSWRDTRTAIDILSKNSKGGWCEIPGFNPDLHVVKHIPQNDCALEILMLLSAIRSE
jgi:hypothetical protein